ncbi:hypothetical protein TNCT_9511 [Trichonephila clavata]|uniref:Uncharacterized protein n=1 Tax=Trichonephila clavata TaxID=2740835 RepID=A0A8X6L4Y1_TRICU|nr:hypothetical protein TNCT_9511 [Trichonephila clavata]
MWNLSNGIHISQDIGHQGPSVGIKERERVKKMCDRARQEVEEYLYYYVGIEKGIWDGGDRGNFCNGFREKREKLGESFLQRSL